MAGNLDVGDFVFANRDFDIEVTVVAVYLSFVCTRFKLSFADLLTLRGIQGLVDSHQNALGRDTGTGDGIHLG